MSKTFDPMKLLTTIYIVLIMVGVVPFTRVSIGAALLGIMTSLEFTWR